MKPLTIAGLEPEQQISARNEDSGELVEHPAEVIRCAACEECRGALDAQTSAHRALAARPILPVRDLSGAIRATLESERPWIERLNWRRLSLRMAPIAAALTLVALFLVRTADTTVTAVDASSADPTVASALYSGDVSDEQLLTLFLSAQPDDALSTYVPNVKREQ